MENDPSIKLNFPIDQFMPIQILGNKFHSKTHSDYLYNGPGHKEPPSPNISYR